MDSVVNGVEQSGSRSFFAPEISASSRKKIILWLLLGCMLIASMVVVGGITRLTDSGLSMTDWKLIAGSVPPMSEEAWQARFELYKATPEYKINNSHFTLSEFKSIFWWEYIHRVLGRLIGLVFVVPFAVLLFSRSLTWKLTKNLLVILFLGAFQGFMGWYMVKSGLVDNPDVSHYRLAAHLVTAFILFLYVLWVLLEQVFPNKTTSQLSGWISKISFGLIVITFVQVIYGAFVSGLKAGLIYNTFPKMGDYWMAPSVGYMYERDGLISLFENLASIQFIHRYIAYLVVIIFVVLVVLIFHKSGNRQHRLALIIAGLAISFQVLLGIFTLLYAVPITLGVLHQLGALILLGTMVYLYFHLSADRYAKPIFSS